MGKSGELSATLRQIKAYIVSIFLNLVGVTNFLRMGYGLIHCYSSRLLCTSLIFSVMSRSNEIPEIYMHTKNNSAYVLTTWNKNTNHNGTPTDEQFFFICEISTKSEVPVHE